MKDPESIPPSPAVALTAASASPGGQGGLFHQDADHYRSLFREIDEGFCVIEMIFDADHQAVDYRFLETNPAFSAQTSLVAAEGKRMRELAPQHENFWFETYGEVARTGVARRFEHHAKELSRRFEVVAFRFGAPPENKVALLFKDITGRKRAEEDQRFLLKLSDTLRTGDNADLLGKAATRLIAEHFKADRSFISRISREQGKAWVSCETRKPSLASMEGEHDLSNFPETMRRAATETLVFHDVPADPRLSARDSANLGALKIGALLAPVLRKGDDNYVWDIAISSEQPRTWTSDEQFLMEEIAERTWAALERAQTESALRESEARHSFLIKLSDTLSPLTDPVAVQEAAMQLVGEHLGVSRAAYFEVDPDQNGFVQAAGYETGSVRLPRHMKLSDYGAHITAAYRARRTVVVRDSETDPQVAQQRAAHQAVNVRSWVGVPLVKNDRLIVILGVHHSYPRNWSQEEIALLEAVAERTWAAAERARSEAALRASEAQLKEANRQNNSLLATLSQEAKAPLASIQASLRQLASPETTADTKQQLLPAALAQTTQLEKLFSDLLEKKSSSSTASGLTNKS